MNLIDHIGNKVTVWTAEGNSMTERTLITADEMGIVVSPHLADVTSLPLQKEVFIPWNCVKYVDLLKPREEGLPDYREFQEEPEQAQVHGQCRILKRADEAIQLLGGKPHQHNYPIAKRAPEPERANIGDIIRDYQGRRVIVEDVANDGSVCGRYEVGDGGSCSQLGSYTIVGGVIKPREVPEDKAPEPTTAELVDTLSEREGVGEYILDPSQHWIISRWWDGRKDDDFMFSGPARVLVVID